MRSTLFALAASTAWATDVSVVWRHEKPSGATSLTIHSANDNAVLAESCGSSLGSLQFANVDEHGAGNFSIGAITFDVVSHSQDGVSCTRMYNGIVTVVECSNVKMDVPENAVQSADCFSDGEAKDSFLMLRSRNIDARDASPTPVSSKEDTTPSRTSKLWRRQYGGQCHDESGIVQVGDGNPHQNYFKQQLSEVVNCGAAPSCAVGHERTKSFTIGFSSSVSAKGWIAAGFDVQKSWSTGNQYTCYGAAGDDVCVWYNTAHTAYTVRRWYQNTCLGRGVQYEPEYILKSPNTANRGGGMYCVIGTCRAQGDGYWDNDGRAGGP